MSKTAQTHLIVLLIVAGVAIAALLWSGIAWLLPVWWLFWGLVTFAYYGFDKRQAGRGGWRVPESILHLIALTGGFAGGWAGMYTFRHKTRVTAFKVALLVATAAWLGVALWLWQAGIGE